MLCLGSGTPSLTAQPPAPFVLTAEQPVQLLHSRLSVMPSSSLSGGRPGPVLRLSNSTELTGGRILTSFRVAFAFRFTPRFSVGLGPSVSKLDLPEGRVRAYEGIAFLRFTF
jgi:hypothetical protein